jgi:hypothetical protein
VSLLSRRQTVTRHNSEGRSIDLYRPNTSYLNRLLFIEVEVYLCLDLITRMGAGIAQSV